MAARDSARRQAPTLDELESHGISLALRIDYDKAVADPSGTEQRIAEYADLPVTAAATAFIAPELRRHRPAQPIDTTRNYDQGVTTLTT
jgi:hypothetical protein